MSFTKQVWLLFICFLYVLYSERSGSQIFKAMNHSNKQTTTVLGGGGRGTVLLEINILSSLYTWLSDSNHSQDTSFITSYISRPCYRKNKISLYKLLNIKKLYFKMWVKTSGQRKNESRNDKTKFAEVNTKISINVTYWKLLLNLSFSFLIIFPKWILQGFQPCIVDILGQVMLCCAW